MRPAWPTLLILVAGAVGCNAVPDPILGALDDPDPAVRKRAVVRMRTYTRTEPRPEAARRLVSIARQDPAVAVRLVAIRSLMRYPHRTKVRACLLALLADPEPRVRREAAATLARFADPAVGQALCYQFSTDPDARVRIMALAACVYRNTHGAKDLVHLAMQDSAASVRQAARGLSRRYEMEPALLPATQPTAQPTATQTQAAHGQAVLD